jgi:hypothetical protein
MMTTDRDNLVAFIGILLAICYLATIAAVLAYAGKYAEALGFGGLTTGLVGVIGTFKPKQPITANVEQADTVVQGSSAPSKE